MIGRTVWLKLAAFLAVTVFGVSYILIHYIGIGRTLLGQSYTAYVDLADSGGIFPSASVTYRGIEIGRVGEITLRDKGIRVELDLDAKPRVPEDVRAVIGNGSALGEQYIDLQPKTDSGPFLEDDSVIPEGSTELPVSTATLLVNLDKLVNSVPKEDLRTLVSELGTGFADTGPALQRLLDATGSLVGTANDRVDETIRLLEDAQKVLDTQNDLSNDTVAFSRSLASFSAALRGADGDLRKLLDTGVSAAAEVTALDTSIDTTLPITLGNLVSVGQVAAVRIPAIRQVLIIYPYIVATSYGLFPGDGTTRFGVPVPPSYETPPCIKGYLDPSKRRLPTDLAYPPIRYNSFCKEPTSSGVGPRGSRQAPQPNGSRLGDDPAYMSNAGLPQQSPEPEPGGSGGANVEPSATLSTTPGGSYLLASTGGQAASGPWKDSSWSALILGTAALSDPDGELVAVDEPAAPLPGARRRRALLPLLLAILLCGLLAGVVLTALDTREAEARADDQQAALLAARQQAVNLTTISHETADRDLARIIAAATGTLKTQFQTQAKTFPGVLRREKSVSVGRVLAAGVKSQQGGTVDVLVAVDATVRNAASGENGVVKHYRMDMRLVRIDARWLVSTVAFAGLPQ